MPPSGSSPRGRGTRWGSDAFRWGPRFIPARAGNAPTSMNHLCQSPVHPRAGGERATAGPSRCHRGGSSPRGRGTRRGTRASSGSCRFIPARAGNAPTAAVALDDSSVHPRAGGERRFRLPAEGSQHGSSPRGRGTPHSATSRPFVGRFIPARAGNAPSTSAALDDGSVHPRAGGERAAATIPHLTYSGSSPRGRGTRRKTPPLWMMVRFIPARAGNARGGNPNRFRCAVHPRAGGERAFVVFLVGGLTGSSPRGRGTLA